MRIAIIGPTFPYKGGIPLHTTELAHRLQAAGHDVQLISWKRQYPGFLYPGEQRLPNGKPELPLFANTTAPLTWYNPLGWWRAGRRLRRYDLVIVTYFAPHFQGTSGLVMLRALGRAGKRPRVLALCHNVVQHDPRPGETLINKLFLSRVDGVIVHSERQAALARQFTAVPVRVAAMPPHLPAATLTAQARHRGLHRNLLFFGLVRRYKGVDVLLEALAQLPDINLTIAGETWGEIQAELDSQIDRLGLRARVNFKPGYVPAEQLPEVFAKADALVLPYRGGSATQNVEMGFAHGVPVIATSAALHPGQIKDDVDGLVCDPDNTDSLARAIRHFYEPGVATRLRKHVPKQSAGEAWDAYLETVLAA